MNFSVRDSQHSNDMSSQDLAVGSELIFLSVSHAYRYVLVPSALRQTGENKSDKRFVYVRGRSVYECNTVSSKRQRATYRVIGECVCHVLVWSRDARQRERVLLTIGEERFDEFGSIYGECLAKDLAIGSREIGGRVSGTRRVVQFSAILAKHLRSKREYHQKKGRWQDSRFYRETTSL